MAVLHVCDKCGVQFDHTVLVAAIVKIAKPGKGNSYVQQDELCEACFRAYVALNAQENWDVPRLYALLEMQETPDA